MHRQLLINTRGFTIVEVAIVIPILIGIAIVLYTILYNMVATSATVRQTSNLIYDKQVAIDTIEEDSVLAQTYQPNSVGYNDPYAPSGGWSYKGTGTTSRVLIMHAYSTVGNPLSPNRSPVFIGSGSNCNADKKYLNDVLMYNIIYFVQNGNLYRRRVTDTTTATCSPQYQALSCPALAPSATITPSIVTSPSPRNSLCKANDEIITTDVSNFTVAYYDSKSSTTPLDVYAASADPDLVSTAVDVEVTVGLTRNKQTDSIILRMSRLNSVPEDD